MEDLNQLKQLVFLDRKIRRYERTLLRKHTQNAGLTPNQLLVLDTLLDFPSSSAHDLAQILQLNKSTVSTLTQQLLVQKLIIKQLDPGNNSRFQLSVTDKGRHASAGVYEAYLVDLQQKLGFEAIPLAPLLHILQQIADQITD